MYNVSEKYKKEIRKLGGRSFKAKVLIRNKEYTDDEIIDMELLENVNASDNFNIGSVVSNSFTLNLASCSDYFDNAIVEPYIGLELDNEVEFIPLGVFKVDNVSVKNKITKLECVDNMISLEKAYFSKLSYPANINDVIKEICSIAKVEFKGALPNYNIDKIEGYSLREAIGIIAALCGSFARFNRNGHLEITTYNYIDEKITPDSFFTFEKDPKEFLITKVTAKKGDETLTKGSSEGNELIFDNPVINPTILNDIYGMFKEYKYTPYSLKWQGNPAIMAGDKLIIIGLDGKEHTGLIMEQKLTYNGGIISEFKAVGKTQESSSFNRKGSITQAMERYEIEQANIKVALIDKASINQLEAVNAKIQNLYTDDLVAINAKIQDLKSVKADIIQLNTLDANIKSALIQKAETTDLNAAIAKVGILENNVANINTLVNGNLSSENIQAGGITSDKLTIANGFITNAMISNLDVSKINAGDISTNKFKIKSDDGGIEIVGATQQFKDKNNKVRIQMGKDTQGNFNFILRGEDGTTTLIDHNGIKEKAISDNLIKENMISQNAVGEKAIDYNSFANGFNKDTNTNTLKATKVKLDNQKQTLEVAFNSLKNQSDGTKSQTESNTTKLNVHQGKISALIQDTTINKDGFIVKLKDDYNRTVATVDSIKNTISSHETLINQNTGKITGVESKTNTLERDLQSTTNKITNVEKKVDDLSIDNNNLIPNTDFSKDKTKYYKPWGTGTTIQYSKDPSANGQIVPSHILVVNKLNPTVAGGNVCIETPKVIGGIKANLEYTLSFKAMSRGNTGALDYLYVMSNEEGLANYRIVNEKNKLVINSFGNIEKVSTITFKLNKTYKNASILIGKVKQALANENLYHGFGIWDIILTQGNKIVAWHQAAEDIRSEIDITTSNVSEIKQNLNSITQRVVSTESTTSNINSKLTTLEIWKREAEQKITDSSIINTVSSQFYKKSESDTIFANKTQLTQLDNKFEFKITTVGANNLIANSSFEGGFAEWQLFNKPILSTNTEFLADRYGRMISIESGGGEGIFQRFKTIPGESYTVSFYAEADRQKPLATSIGIEGIHLITLIYEPGWKRWSFTFTATSKVHTFIAYLGQAGKFYLGRVMVTQGTVLQEYREGLGIYSNVVSIDKSGLTVDSSNTNTRTITDSQGFRVQDKSTGENLLEANKKGVSAKGGRFYVDGPGGNYTLLWGRDININGGRAIVGTNATPEAPLKPKKMYINYNNDFTNGVEIGGKLTNNTFEVVSMKENQLGGQYIYRAMGDGLIYQCGYKEIKIRDGWIIEDVVNFPKPFPNYCTKFKAYLELVDGNNYWTANYTLNSYRLDRLGGKVYGLNQKTYIDSQGAVARIFWEALGA